MLFVNSGQLNQDNVEFVNFPDFCKDAAVVELYSNVFIFKFPTDCKHIFEQDSPPA